MDKLIINNIIACLQCIGLLEKLIIAYRDLAMAYNSLDCLCLPRPRPSLNKLVIGL